MVQENKRDPDRHLKIVEGRPIQFRATIDRGECFCGHRITVPLRTTDIDKARIRRDLIENALLKAAYVRRDLLQ